MGWETRWFSEIDPYASAVLKKHWPDVPNLGDITKITNPPPVDVLVGGFPCQDISVAGKGEGIGGARSGLWKQYARIIGEVSPQWVVIENSPRLRSLGLDVVLKDLMALGYDAEWHCIPACAVGAPHQRDRAFIVAYPHGKCVEPVLSRSGATRGSEAPSSRTLDVDVADSRRDDLRQSHVADAYQFGAQVPASREQPAVEQSRGDSSTGSFGGWRPDWTTESGVGRVVHGIPSRLDRLKCLGNAIVPQVAYEIFRSIEAYEQQGG